MAKRKRAKGKTMSKKKEENNMQKMKDTS